MESAAQAGEQISKASEYLAKRGTPWTVEVPSGARFLVNRPNLLKLMRQGTIPSKLYNAAMRAGGQVGPGSEQKPDDIKDSLEFMARYVCASVADPKIVLYSKDKADGQLGIDDLEDDDLTALFNAVFQKEGKKESGEKPGPSFSPPVGSSTT